MKKTECSTLSKDNDTVSHGKKTQNKTPSLLNSLSAQTNSFGLQNRGALL